MNRIIVFMMAQLIFIPHSVRAYIYDTQVVRKWDAQLNDYQYIVGLCDYHDRMHPENKIHRAQLESLLSQSDKENMRVVVEDLSCRGEGCTQAYCNNFIVNTRGGVLGGLAEFCVQKGIPVHNMEYRYCRVAAIGPMLRHAHAPLQEFTAIHQVSLNTLVDEIQSEVKTIESFAIGDKALEAWYVQSLKEIEDGLKRLHLQKHTDMTIAQYLEVHSRPEKRFLLLNELLTFDSILLDLKLVHAIANMRDKKIIVVIAGGTHINRMNDALKNLGFTLAQGTSVSYKKEHDLHKCLGANVVEGSFCVKPQPVDIISTMQKYVIKNETKMGT